MNEDGDSRCVILCDHASNHLPSHYRNLGLPPYDLHRAIAWDIGAAAVTEMLALRLDAAAFLSTASRLLIDCNRPPNSQESVPEFSEDTTIPGNARLSSEDVERRAARHFWPYHDRIAACLDRRAAEGRETWVISIHSFTPVYAGRHRPWHIGFTYGRDARLARRLIEHFRANPELIVGDNEPYPVYEDGDYSLPEHGERRGHLCVLVEIRQDLIRDTSGARAWAAALAEALSSMTLTENLENVE